MKEVKYKKEVVSREFIKLNTKIAERKVTSGAPLMFLSFTYKEKYLYRCFIDDKHVYKSIDGRKLFYLKTANHASSFVDIVYHDLNPL